MLGKATAVVMRTGERATAYQLLSRLSSLSLTEVHTFSKAVPRVAV
jgi:hypothetical protein